MSEKIGQLKMKSELKKKMKAYIKTYSEYYGYEEGEYIPCRVCGAESVDIHHIVLKGMGGAKAREEQRQGIT